MNNKKRIKKVYLKTSNDNYINNVMSNQREIIAINKAEINKLKRDLPDLMYKSPKGANNKNSLSTMKSNEICFRRLAEMERLELRRELYSQVIKKQIIFIKVNIRFRPYHLTAKVNLCIIM